MNRWYGLKAGAGVFFFSLALILTSCGGGSNPAPPPQPIVSALTVTPSSANVGLGQSVAFTAKSGTTTVTANWSVNGVAGGNATVGTITAVGTYTAPGAFPNPPTVTITAALTTDPTQTGTATATVALPNNTATAQNAPVSLGTSGGNSTDQTTKFCCSGTLGSLWTRGTGTFILSNNHVLFKSDRGTAGDNVTQPGLVDDNCGQSANIVVAQVTEAAALKPTAGTTGPSPSNVDAAIAQIVTLPTPQVDTSGAILDLGAAGNTSIAAAPPSSTLAVPQTVLSTSEKVAKVGRSTALTCSTLSSISTNIQVDYETACGSNTTAFTSTFSNQLLIAGGNFSAAGDSGSLVVTADTARPLGLLYAGSNTDSSANPIGDVIKAFTNSSGTPAIVGAGDHTVSCAAVGQAQSASLSSGFGANTLSPREAARVSTAKTEFGSTLMLDARVSGVDIGASTDNPQEGAVVLHMSGLPSRPVPQEVGGVRTRLVFDTALAQTPVLQTPDINRAIGVKEAHANAWMSSPGIQGIGVGRSDDNPLEPAIVIYTVRGQAHPAIPAVIDGMRTKVVDSDRFRAYGWGRPTVAQPKACKPGTKPQASSLAKKKS